MQSHFVSDIFGFVIQKLCYHGNVALRTSLYYVVLLVQVSQISPLLSSQPCQKWWFSSLISKLKQEEKKTHEQWIGRAGQATADGIKNNCMYTWTHTPSHEWKRHFYFIRSSASRKPHIITEVQEFIPTVLPFPFWWLQVYLIFTGIRMR